MANLVNLHVCHDILIQTGQFQGRTVGQLSLEDLRKVATSRASTASAKRWVAAAKARLSILEFAQMEPTVLPPAEKPPLTQEPAPCQVLALVPQQRRRGPGPDAHTVVPSRRAMPWWQFALIMLITLLAYPSWAAAPGFLMGWLVRFLANRFALIFQHFVASFTDVIGDLIADTAAFIMPYEKASQGLSGMTLMLVAWFVARKAA
jgi:hypothetical protein